MPVGIRGEGEPTSQLALRVELQKLVRHVAHTSLYPGLGALPGNPSQAIDLRFGLATAAKLLHQVHARERHIELALVGILQQHEVRLYAILHHFLEAEETADTVLAVHHQIPGLEIRDIQGK